MDWARILLPRHATNSESPQRRPREASELRRAAEFHEEQRRAAEIRGELRRAMESPWECPRE
eukprot:11944074-Alexandrium_andersonii.AAC.1